MTNQNSEIYQAYLPVYDSIPEKWDEAKPFFVETLKKISNIVNTHERGFYIDEEIISGQQFFPSSTTSDPFRSTLRKVIDFKTLPTAGTTKSVAHGIAFNSSFTLTRLYGAATNPTGLIAIPLDSIHGGTRELWMDATKVYVKSSVDDSAYTRCLIIIEYMQEI